MLTEKQIEDVIEELEGIISMTNIPHPILLPAEITEIRIKARTALVIIRTVEPQSRDCW